MSANYLSFEGFTAACENAATTIVRPYGIYHRRPGADGIVFWHWELMKRSGHAVRYFVEEPGWGDPIAIVLDLDGNLICHAHTPADEQRDSAWHREMEALRATMTPEQWAAYWKEDEEP